MRFIFSFFSSNTEPQQLQFVFSGKQFHVCVSVRVHLFAFHTYSLSSPWLRTNLMKTKQENHEHLNLHSSPDCMMFLQVHYLISFSGHPLRNCTDRSHHLLFPGGATDSQTTEETRPRSHSKAVMCWPGDQMS